MDFQLRKHSLPYRSCTQTHVQVQCTTISTNTSFLLTPPPPPSTFLNGRVDNQDDISAIPVLTWVITID